MREPDPEASITNLPKNVYTTAKLDDSSLQNESKDELLKTLTRIKKSLKEVGVKLSSKIATAHTHQKPSPSLPKTQKYDPFRRTQSQTTAQLESQQTENKEKLKKLIKVMKTKAMRSLLKAKKSDDP
jgi:hypothetical protein